MARRPSPFSHRDFLIFRRIFIRISIDQPIALYLSWSAAPLKCKIFCWLARKKRLPTNERRFRHHLTTSAACLSCNTDEDTDHLLLFCPRATDVWEFFHCGFDPSAYSSFSDLCLKNSCSYEEATINTAIAWNIWKCRNALTFNGVVESGVRLRGRRRAVTDVTDDVMVMFVFVVGDMPMPVTGVTGGVLVVFVFVVGDMVMLVTGVTDGVMVVFVFVVGDMPMLVTGVTGGVLVVFVFLVGVGDMVMLVTGVTDGVMVVFVFVVGDVPMFVTGSVLVVLVFVDGDMVLLVTGVTDGVMVVFVFVVGDMPMRVTASLMVSWWSSSSWSATW
ncbi:hypothetical protein QYE76_015152 [Lolium multiflorum]|uniref:Reverse transcriptase zinc-binding domain-containing protein n=1 Tax=Lolium multiflorum TaxID=4521 RepID=A0AAD8U213_LOLMU|nr:hypothetical protein QYE76_015152 [Lolium multiflorum]